MSNQDKRINSIRRTQKRAEHLYKKIHSYSLKDFILSPNVEAISKNQELQAHPITAHPSGIVFNAVGQPIDSDFKIDHLPGLLDRKHVNVWISQTGVDELHNFGGALVNWDDDSESGLYSPVQVDDSDYDLPSDLVDSGDSYDLHAATSSDIKTSCKIVASYLSSKTTVPDKWKGEYNKYVHQYHNAQKLINEKKQIFKHKSIPSMIKTFLSYHPASSVPTVSHKLYLTKHWTQKYRSLLRKYNRAHHESLKDMYTKYIQATEAISYHRWKIQLLLKCAKAQKHFLSAKRRIKKNNHWGTEASSKSKAHKYEQYANNDAKRFKIYTNKFHKNTKRYGMGSLNPNGMICRKAYRNEDISGKYLDKLHKGFKHYRKMHKTSAKKRAYAKQFHQYTRKLFA